MSIYSTEINNILKKGCYSLNNRKKNKFFFKQIKKLNEHHIRNCKNYKKITSLYNISKINELDNLPMLPTRLFKKYDLKSTNQKIVKIIESSGTSGISSKISLDNENAINQTLVLRKLFQDSFGKERFPMLVFDRNVKNKKKFDASMAAIMGFSIFGIEHTFALKENGQIDYSKIIQFYKKYKNKRKFLFGFTYKIYEILINKFDNKKFNLSFKNDFLLHGGGWKKLQNLKISNKLFKKKLKDKYQLTKVINYYGMVEQAGSIFFECEKNDYFHVSDFSEIFIRDKDLSLCKNNNKGIVQLLSILPKSYPGHNLLTEDIGEIIGVDDCSCGRKGKYFKIHGRVSNAELRGCSDVL